MRRTTLLLLAIGAAVGVVVWTELQRGDPGASAEREPVEIFPFGGDEVVGIDVARDGKRISLKKDGATWRLTEPHAWPAGTTAVMILLRSVDPMEKGSPLPPGTAAPEAAVHGLDAPRLVVTLAAGSGKTAAVAFGKDVGAGDRVYARRPGQPSEVFTLPKAVAAAFDRSPESLRDTGFCRFDYRSTKSIAYRSGEKLVRVVRQGRGWRLSGEAEDLGDPATVEEWTVRLAGAQTETFAPRPAGSRADFGFEPPFASFDIELEGRSIRVLVGAPVKEGDDRRWAETSEYPDDIGTMTPQLLDLLTPLPAALRASRALPWPLAEADAVVATGGVPYEVQRQGATWSVIRPAILTRFAPARVDSLLKELAQAPAASGGTAQPPAGAPTLTFRWGTVEHSARIWSDGTDTFIRTSDPDRVVRAFTTSLHDHVAPGPHFFRDPAVPTDLIPLQVKTVSITDRNGVIWVEAEFNGRVWTSTSPVAGGKALDSDKMSRLNVLWAGMIAETWLPVAKDAPETGLAGAPAWKIRLIPDPGRASNAKERVFLVGSDGPGNTMYAVLEGSDEVFLVDPHAAGMLRGGVWKD
ncbi:MAG: DUF4340 domain-containing protein [Planctomycetia bacterium]|nr:DUF4340 domain-containing protein [Planctomycetia bacterium]